MTIPAVSFIVACYNAARYVPEFSGLSCSTLARTDITRTILPYFSPHWVWATDWMLWIRLAATGYDFL